MPLVSVVIATFNRPEFLTRAVSSALGQTVTDIEVVVVVEREDTVSIPALNAIADDRVRYVLNPERRGPGPARDIGAKASVSLWIAFLDDDDEWLPRKLEKQLTAAPDPTATISMTLSQVVTSAGTFVRPASSYDGEHPIDEWLFGRASWFKGGQSMLQTSSLMVPRAMFEHLCFGASRHEEWELAIRALKQHGYRLVTVNEALVIYYAGHSYPWRRSADWVEGVRDLITPRAYSGFCLTVATQGVETSDRNRAFFTLLRMALLHGRPTAKQIFAFVLIWLVPDRLRHRARAAMGGHATVANGVRQVGSNNHQSSPPAPTVA